MLQKTYSQAFQLWDPPHKKYLFTSISSICGYNGDWTTMLSKVAKVASFSKLDHDPLVDHRSTVWQNIWNIISLPPPQYLQKEPTCVLMPLFSMLSKISCALFPLTCQAESLSLRESQFYITSFFEQPVLHSVLQKRLFFLLFDCWP